MTNFINAGARRDFIIVSISTFLAFTTYSQLALLAVVLTRNGIDEKSIGLLLSAPLPVVFFVMLFSGRLVQRYGTLAITRFGVFVMSIAYMSLHVTTNSPYLTSCSIMAFGIGYGIFMPAVMAYADSQLLPTKRSYYFGIYSSMIPLPTVIGPVLAQAYLDRFGANFFFVISGLPAAAAVMLMAFARHGPRRTGQSASWGNYVALIQDSRLRTPYTGIILIGLLYGFISSFMGLLLASSNVPAGAFFTAYMISFMTSRFILLNYLSSISRHGLVAIGMILMSFAYLALSLQVNYSSALVAGVLFGLGYSVAFPTLIADIADQFALENRGMPIALFSALFAGASYALPAAGGFVIRAADMHTLILGLTCFGFAATFIFVLQHYLPKRVTSAAE